LERKKHCLMTEQLLRVAGPEGPATQRQNHSAMLFRNEVRVAGEL
jgi:hypothetical protein